MTKTEFNRTLAAAVDAARAAGALMRQNLNSTKKVHARAAHDIKLELDVRCQNLIQRRLHQAFPEITLLGEEGEQLDSHGEYRWVVDPIDGTVNYSHGIPHACVSIALQQRGKGKEAKTDGGYLTQVGVIFDPFMDELWTATRGGAARLNGRRIQVSKTNKLSDAIVSMGFGKNEETVRACLPRFAELSVRARKVRNIGSAAIALAYVASGRYDAYTELGISLWDIAAGGLILQCAGGEFWRTPAADPLTYRMIATNGKLRRALATL